MVVVAATPLRFGDRLTRENLREIPWTAGALPAGAYHRTTDLLDAKLGDRQVLTAIGANEPILAWKVTGPGQRATLSAVLAVGMKAVSIRVNDVQGVAGFVLPGDRVDVMLSRSQNDQAFVDVLLQNIKVLAIDQTADDKKENPTVAKSVTVEVSTLDAQKLTLAASVGQLSLALREVAANTGEATQRVSLSDLGGASLALPAPAAPAPAPAAIATKPTHASIDVYRGTQLQTYEVPLSN
jgi:pilus assembly protein CpaB